MRAENPDQRLKSGCANTAQVPLSLCPILLGLAERRGNPESLAKPAQRQSESGGSDSGSGRELGKLKRCRLGR